MKIRKIKINNFRQYVDCDIDFTNNFTSFIGDNGSGKSALRIAIIFGLYGLDFIIEQNFFEDVSFKSIENLCNKHHIGENICVEVFLTDNQDNSYVVRSEVRFDDSSFQNLPQVIIKSKENNFTEKPFKYDDFLRLYPKNLAMFSIVHGEKLNSVSAVMGKSKGNIDIKKEIEDIAKVTELKEKLKIIKKTNQNIQSQISKSQEVDEKTRSLIDNELASENAVADITLSIMDIKQRILKQDELIEENKNIFQQNEEIRELQVKKDELITEIKSSEAQKDELVTKIENELFTNIYKFSMSNFFKNNLESSRQLFTDAIPGMTQDAIDHLLQEDDCICGNKISLQEIDNLSSIKNNQPPENILGSISKKMYSFGDDISSLEENMTQDFKKVYDLTEKIEVSKSILRAMAPKEKALSLKTKTTDVYEQMLSHAKTKGALEEELNKYEQDLLVEEDLLNTYRLEKQRYISTNPLSINKLQKANQILDVAIEEINSRLKTMEGFLKNCLELSTNELVNAILKDGTEIKIANNYIPTVNFKNGATAASDGQNDVISICYLLGLLRAVSVFGELYVDTISINSDLFPIVLDGIIGKLDFHNIEKVMLQINHLDTQIIMMNSDKNFESIEKYLKSDVINFDITRDENSNESRIIRR